ncbi:IclR family transcriptional regulator [Paenibacillus sp. FSL R5-0744]|uniref:IclR family transcriptional regulator n=1 Tax=Paenibacillus sp. FSL R5-0744 TaxID=2921656 RepID=UPI0030DBC7E9
MDQYEVATLKKGLHILDALQQGEPMRLTEIMHRFNLNKSTTFRLLYTLELTGFIQKEGHTYKASELKGHHSSSANTRLNWLVVPSLHQLANELGETAYIGILDGMKVMTVQVVESNHAIRSHTHVGDSAYAHLSAFGKVILAHLSDEQLKEMLTHLTQYKATKQTFDDNHLLKEHLNVIRQQGYAIDDEETEVGLRCVAAPIFYNSKVIAALAISGPAARLNRKRDRAVSKILKECSAQISSQL